MKDAYQAFRLNFEQQQKRAKELLKAARSGDHTARSRFQRMPLCLAEAQFIIARDLRFESWAELKRHVTAMQKERAAPLDTALDEGIPTLHIRCGSDLQIPLQEAGLRGDFYEHNYPYLIGPVREGPDCLDERAQFIIDSYADSRAPPLTFQAVRHGLESDERRLREAAHYPRVVIWSEGDTYDQLVLVRLLGHFSRHGAPSHLELINRGDFPGAVRFIGLGQLPPEALRLVWATRRRAEAAQLQLSLAAWDALISADPRPLAAIMRSGTPALPLLAPALHRHLRELPALTNGLSLTEELALKVLSAGPQNLISLIGRVMFTEDPLPGQGDLNARLRVLSMEQASGRVFTRRPGLDPHGAARPPWTDVLDITPLGRAVLSGEVDFRTLQPPLRWVGGVPVGTTQQDWRWDETARSAVGLS